jgi:DNA mismatch repair protein MutL
MPSRGGRGRGVKGMTASEGTPTIQLLDPSEAMKIAAGEVVERPASVVKELVENSLDAGSGRIRVEVTSDRKQVTRITVTDDGAGMNRADARLAFLPHATSKIRALSDLEETLSLGFRGEALASIASVSQVTLVTRCRVGECGTGTRVLARGGEILEVGDAGAPPGTTVTVEDLFYNTPARQKFLKSLQTELAQVAGTIEALAISHPLVVFQFVQNGRERLATHRGPDLLEAIRAVYGDELAGSLIPLSRTHPLAEIAGYISTPSSSWKTPSRVLVSINGRPVFSRQILRAIRHGYGTLLPSHTFPVAFLDLRIDPSRVDVNVHPTKRVVRVGREQEILAVIEEAVRETLAGEDLTPSVARGDGARGPPSRATRSPPPGSMAVAGIPGGGAVAREPSPASARLTDQRLRQTELPTGMTGEESLVPELEVLGQIGGTYILARTPADDLILVDQHAAHERVLYDQVTERRDARRVSQELLVPVILRESPREAALLRGIVPLLAERGFLVEEFGKDTFLVRGIPSVLGRLEDAAGIQDLLGDIFSGEVDSPDEAGELISRSIACKGAIKAGTAITREQCERLLAQLRATRSPYTCPHGRPTMVSFSRSALDALFKRT